ncbi:MAG TPA: DUF1028 domain-containing protein [Dehalococcoidia bacterium]|nr:DUF1028 domain-containing protein [Dehalococcoidia bacterium]
MTFSIVARCPQTGELGMAVASASLACAASTVNVRAGVGAVASQASGNRFYGPDSLRLLAEGTVPAEVVARVTAGDPAREMRQLLIVDTSGNCAGFTGSSCLNQAGHLIRQDYVVGGNRLADGVLDAMSEAFDAAAGEDLTERLLRALEAGDSAGGELGGRQSAGIKVSADPDYSIFDLRVDDHATPVSELRRLVGLRRESRRGDEVFRPTREQPVPPGFLEKWPEIKRAYEEADARS